MSHTKRHTYATTHRSPIDLTLSENPMGPSPKAIEAIIDATRQLHKYPHEEQTLIRLIAEHHNIEEDTILLGAGANELLEDFLKVLALGKNIVAPAATFPESVACMATLHGSAHSVQLNHDLSIPLNALLEACTPHTALIHLCNPNNPTGIWTEPALLNVLADRSPIPLLISEAGADFLQKTMIDRSLHPNIIIVRSFSKAYGLAGLRVGYSVATPSLTAKMKPHLRSYRVSSLAIAAAIAALQDQDHLRNAIAYVMHEKAWLMQEMGALGFEIVPSQGQTFMARVPKAFESAEHFCAIAKQFGIAVVNCSLYPGLAQYIRISPQNQLINKNFISILRRII